MTDDSRFLSATGGINKDSTSIEESPHARYETFYSEINKCHLLSIEFCSSCSTIA